MKEERNFKSKLLELIESIQDDDVFEYLYWYISEKIKAGQ